MYGKCMLISSLNYPQYCLIETDVNVRRFVTPTEEQILAHRVIVATLNTSRIIASLKLEKGTYVYCRDGQGTERGNTLLLSHTHTHTH